MNHTPGPWHVEEKGKDLLVKYKDHNCTDPVICTMESDVLFGKPNPNSRELANANLVAAAPEMYKMLSKLSGLLTDINAHTHVREIESLLSRADGVYDIKPSSAVTLFNKEYDGESLSDVGRDVMESFDERFNQLAKDIPVDRYGFQTGTFTVRIMWDSE